MRPALLLAASIALLAVPADPAGTDQNPPQQAPPVFKTVVDLVQVDVSVLDNAGRPVKGLAAPDFTILENGAPQAVAAFVAIHVPDPDAGAAAWLRGVAPDVRSNTLGDGRLFALVIDDATMPFEVRTLANVRRIAQDVINRLGPDDLAAVIYTKNSQRSIDFTNDRARLLASVEAAAASSAYTDPQTDNWSYFSSVRTLGQVSAYLGTVPQRRKALIYVSTGVPVDPETVANVTVLSPKRLESNVEESTSEDLAQNMFELVESRPQDAYGRAMQDAFVRAQHGNVNIYAIDPAGLGGLQAYLERRTTAQEQDRRTRAVTTPVRSNPLDAYQRARLSRDFLQTVAVNSGGRAFFDTNDVDAGVAQIFRENSSYYLLGYRSAREPGDKRMRKVEVRIQRPGATAVTRNAYFDPRARPKADLPPPFQIANALSGVLPAPDLALQAVAAAFAGPDRKSAVVAVAVGVQHAVPGDVGGRVQETLRLEAAALTPRGQTKGASSQVAQLKFRSGVGEDARYEVLTRLTLPPGQYQLRIAAHSEALQRNGSVYLDLDVPDFSSGATQLSGIVLNAQPAWTTAPPGALADLLPVTPTTVREFEAGTAVVAFARVYDHSRRGATVEARITDEHDAVVFRHRESIAADRFSSQDAAEYNLTLPIATLKPGRYLLTLEPAPGVKSAARHVRFAVK
jgi:VWFA-related protein